MLPHLYLDSITTLAIPVNLGHDNKVFKSPLQELFTAVSQCRNEGIASN